MMTGTSSRLTMTVSAIVSNELELEEGIRNATGARKKTMWRRWLTVKGIGLRGKRRSPFISQRARPWARL
jgi:hypothetical protein